MQELVAAAVKITEALLAFLLGLFSVCGTIWIPWLFNPRWDKCISINARLIPNVYYRDWLRA
jgi:hypothetical protein